ncbi:hypothetical protein L9G16_15055 [Shewanella sp. A25]|nr:hypothetical protein [Shewanella shenzhenensis]
MSRFQLDSLPQCGAKTRSGTPCQRYGNKTNGRCKLHGGRSTGAKTREGKLAVRVNAVANTVVWYTDSVIQNRINEEDTKNAVTAYLRILELSISNTKAAYDEAMAIVEQFRVELEMHKYYLCQHDGPEALRLIQSALDHYYKDAGNDHLFFHVHAIMHPPAFFNQKLFTKTQLKEHLKWELRIMKTKGEYYYTQPRRPKYMRELRKQSKAK